MGTISRTRRRGSRCCPGVAAPPAGGVLFPVVYHGRDSGRWSAPVDRVASRSAHIAVGAGHGRPSSTWLKYLGPSPGEGASLKGGTCAPVPAQPQGRQGRADRKGGHLPHGSEAQGGMSRAHRPSRGERRQSWTPGHGPHLCGPPGSAPLDAVRLLQGRAGRSRPLSRPICTTPNQEAAWQALTDFSESEMSGQVPPDGDDLGAGLGAIHPSSWTHRPMLRRVISPPLRGRYPLHQQHRDCELPATQGSPMNRGHFPSDEAVIKLPKAGDLRHLWTNEPENATRTKDCQHPSAGPRASSSKDRSPPTRYKALAQPRHRLPRPNQPLPVKRLHRKLDRSRSVSSGSPVALSSPGVRRPPTGLIISSGQISP